MIDGRISERQTLDDLVLLPAKSCVLPAELDTRTRFTDQIGLNILIVSAAMDTLTVSQQAIVEAQQGGGPARKPCPGRHHHKGRGVSYH